MGLLATAANTRTRSRLARLPAAAAASSVGPCGWSNGGTGGRAFSFSVAPSSTATIVGNGALSGNTISPVSPALPASATTGDLLIVFVVARSSHGTVAAPGGWTQLVNNTASDNPGMAVFYKIHSGSESAPAITNTDPSGGYGAEMLAIRSVDGTPIYASAAITAFGSGPFPSSPAVNSPAGGIALFWAAHNSDGSPPSSPTVGSIQFSHTSIVGNHFASVLSVLST